MRTTLINTTFWKEDIIDELHIDSKLLYLYMLTNPDKGLANIYPFKKKVISAYSGLSVEQIDVASKQLVKLGYIDIYQGYFILLKGHEMPKKGRFTAKTIEQEKALIDDDILEHFNLLINHSSSGVAPEHKDKDKDKDKDNVIIKKTPNPDINELFAYWHEIIGYEITSRKQANRNACKNLIARHTVDGVKRLTEGVRQAQGDKYAPRIADFCDLQSKLNQLIVWGKSKAIVQEVF